LSLVSRYREAVKEVIEDELMLARVILLQPVNEHVDEAPYEPFDRHAQPIL
jgi:hypothetical protein